MNSEVNQQQQPQQQQQPKQQVEWKVASGSENGAIEPTKPVSGNSDSLPTTNPSESNQQQQQLQQQEEGGARGEWSNNLDFLMSCIGYAVGLGNLWRFPYLCYKNGGGTFLIQYLVCTLFNGIPVFLLEQTLGQLLGQGVLCVWQLCPILKGIGYSTITVVFWMNIFYCVIQAWSLYYFISSIRLEVPWLSCDHHWNTIHCRTRLDVQAYCNDTYIHTEPGSIPTESFQEWLDNCTNSYSNFTSPVREFWEREVLNLSSGIEQIGSLSVELLGCLIFCWTVTYFVINKGMSVSGKLVYFTAMFPYVCMAILLVRGLTLDGASIGLKYYFTLNWEKFLDATAWNEAATQLYFSFGLGVGAWIALSSYNKFHNNIIRDTLIVAAINFGTAIISGVIVFSVIGFMAKAQNQGVDKVASSGSGLTFIVYPQATLNMPFPPIWAVLFFIMMLVLGFGSQFVQTESFFTAVVDQSPKMLRKRRSIFISHVILAQIVAGAVFLTESGFYWFELFNYYAASGFALLFVVFCELIAVFWFYGTERYVEKVEMMLQRKISRFWIYSWKYVSPIISILIFVFSLIQYKPLAFKDYQYPEWGINFGWLLALSSMLSIPVYAVYKFLSTSGTFKERWKLLVRDEQYVDELVKNRAASAT